MHLLNPRPSTAPIARHRAPRRAALAALALLGALGATAAGADDAHAIGLLIPTDTSQRPFDVESHRVEVTVSNTAAVTKITQVFRNHTNRPMEATFVFPIPEGATVSDFSLWINGKKTKGAVLESKEARRIYESIVRRVEDPGLIEYMDGKLFRASIFPIPAGGTQQLELKFGQVLKKQGGMYRYSYPLAVGRKYVTAKTNKDFTLTAKVQSPLPITTVYSPSHKISNQRKSTREVVVGTEEMKATLDKDFELFIGLSKKDIGLNMLTYDADGQGGEPGYFMVALAPRVDAKAHEEIGQTFTFVMDTSGSMAGEKIEQARKTLAFCLQRLRPQDHFNIVRFSTDVEALYTNPKAATKANVLAGLAFARELEPAGGTAISPALERALGQTTAKGQPHQVIFVTDGIPTVGETDAKKINAMIKAKNAAQTRLFAFGVGYDVNTSLLDGMASQTRGRSDYVKPGENMEEAVSALYTRISSPVLTDIKIDFGKARAYDLYPSPIPDLFQGDQVVLFGRYRDAFSSPIKVTGRIGQEVKTYTFGGEANAEAGKVKREAPPEPYMEPLEFLPKLWATRKVGYLLDQIRANGELPELKTEVIKLAKKFGLVTPYTSYLAVDDSEFQQQRPPIGRPRPDRPRPVDAIQGGGDGFGRTGANFDDSDLEGSLHRPKTTTATRRPPREEAAAPAPAAKRAAERKVAFDAFNKDTGKGAVQASEATRDYKEKAQVEDESFNTRRYIAGRTFVFAGNSWTQDGLKLQGAKIIEVEAYSSAYFDLLRKHRELRRVLRLGDRVTLKLDGRIYRIKPAKTK